MLKNLSLIAIIAVLAYSQVGYYFVMRHSQSVHKKYIKHKIRSQLKDAELEIISLTHNRQLIHWVKKEKEFFFKGEMFDVVKRKTVAGKILLYCINDKKEKALVDNYNLQTKQNSSADKKGKHSVDNSMNLFVYCDEKKDNLNFTGLSNSFASFNSRLAENKMDTISPPPKI